MDTRFLPPRLPPLPPGEYTATVIDADVIFNHKTLADRLVVEFEVQGRRVFTSLDPRFASNATPGSTAAWTKKK